LLRAKAGDHRENLNLFSRKDAKNAKKTNQNLEQGGWEDGGRRLRRRLGSRGDGEMGRKGKATIEP